MLSENTAAKKNLKFHEGKAGEGAGRGMRIRPDEAHPLRWKKKADYHSKQMHYNERQN